MLKRKFKFVLLFLLLIDVSYSFFQHLAQPLDGDMPAGILQTSEVKQILNDPFGMGVITLNEIRPDSNRFFAHWSFSNYFRTMPFVMQKFVDPIDSIYLSCTIFKTLLQIFLIFLLAYYISGTANILNYDFLLSAVLITPLFQTNGYEGCMGIITSSITYTFFYALPMAFLLLLFIPFFKRSFYEEKKELNILTIVLLLLIAIIVSFSGPLTPPTIIIVSALLFISKWWNNFSRSTSSGVKMKLLDAIKQIPVYYFLFLMPLMSVALYSFYVGTFNSINAESHVMLFERYSRLPAGIFEALTNKIGFPILLLLIAINRCLIKWYYNNLEGKRILNLMKWTTIFIVIYIVLLPLGGYRSYRPNTIRCDTIIPITISLFLIYGLSTLFLIKNIVNKNRKWYVTLIIATSVIFTIADGPEFDKNSCERDALRSIASSPDKIIYLQNDCTVIDWQKITDPKNSELKCRLLKYWGVIKEDKLYYQK